MAKNKKNKNKHEQFRQNTKGNDYTNTAGVVDALIAAVNDFKSFELLESGGDTEAAVQKLTASGTRAYQTMEHAYKNYIHRHYEGLFQENKIGWAEMNRETQFEEVGRFYTHSDLKRKFCQIVKNPQADLDLILRGAPVSNNGPKHDGKTPDPQELREQLGEMIKFFRAHLDANAEYPSLADSFAGEQHAWQELYEMAGSFGSEYQYLLIAPPLLDPDKDLSALFSVNWDLVVDFDPSSDLNGIRSVYLREKGISSNIRTLAASEKNKKFQQTTYPQWVMANGFADKTDSVKGNFRAWHNAYGQHFKNVLTKFREVYPKYLKIVVLPGVEESYLKDLMAACDEVFYQEDMEETFGVDFLLLEGGHTCLGVDYDFVRRSDLTLDDFLRGIRGDVKHRAGSEGIKTMPGVTAAEGLSRDLCAKLENFCQPVYIGIEKMEPEMDVWDFYRARRPISWTELANGKDLQRSIYSTGIYGKLVDMLQEHPRLLYDIVYKPGYGGSTMLRRIAWDFHTHYPTLLMLRYEEDDAACLRQLYEKTKLPFLILVDSNFMSRTEAQLIRRDLRSDNINHIVLFMRRRYQANEVKEKSEILNIPSLGHSSGEVERMVDILLPYVTSDSCKTKLLRYRDEADSAEEYSPFYFALSAFDEDFLGIPRYVHNYLSQLSPQLKEYLVFIALADYINRPLDVQFFVGHLRNDKAEDFLNRHLAFRALVSFFDIKGQRFCKIKHSAFATEILRQYTSDYSAEGSQSINFQKLRDPVLHFIEYSRSSANSVNANLTGFLREMLITRREDTDTFRPKFADLISKIGGYDPVTKKCAQHGQEAMGSIFHKLADVYPDDAHFNAHLARYLCYVERSYDEAVRILDNAMDSGDDRTQNDPLLLHMKAMVYVARITNELIPKIKSDSNKTESEKATRPLMDELIRDCNRAQTIFAEVRKLHSGLAGHISDIQLCISIIDLKKGLEQVDTAQFWKNHPSDWYMELGDHANALYDVCEERSADLEGDDQERVESLKGPMLVIREGIEESIKWYQAYLEKAPAEKRPYVRRHLARACAERNKKQNSQKEWRYIADLMEENMREEPDNEANIRTWFNAVLHIRGKDPDEMLRQAIIRLNEWIAISEDNIDAHFFRYILTYVQAVEGSSAAEDYLKSYLPRLKNMAGRLEHRTTIRYWLGNTGRGMERLIHKNDFRTSDPEWAISKLQMLRGRVDLYHSDVHAYIKAYKSDIFFTPFSSAGQITQNSLYAQVIFGVGFSYDGPRAYNASVKLDTGEDGDVVDLRRPELGYGTRVKCRVYANHLRDFINVDILGYPGEKGSIPVDNLAEPYSAENRPAVGGALLEATVLRRKYIDGGTRQVWELTMHPVSYDPEEENTPLKGNKQLQQWMSKFGKK